MPDFPIPEEEFERIAGPDFNFRIRDFVELSKKIEELYGPCVRTEIGEPGLNPPRFCDKAQKDSIDRRDQVVYCSPHTGLDGLK
ncbi:MAG: hypothetical protein V3U72_01500, partial [Candidatus Aenigmarchaeota archaeon]